MSRVGAVTAFVLLTAGAAAASADTIYLANGRVIRTASARIDGDRVVFSQYGGEVSIPLSAVERIVEDEEVERATATPVTDEGTASPTAAAGTGGPGIDPSAPTAASESPAAASSTAAYWVKQIRTVDELIARAHDELGRLPYYDSADRALLRFSGQAMYWMAERDKWEGMLRRYEQMRRQLLAGARKAGIPPGALRDGLGR